MVPDGDGGPQVVPHRVHVHLRDRQFQVVEKYPVQVIVIVLAGMGQDAVKVPSCTFQSPRSAG